MAAPRLSDAQKQDLVSRFRDGAGTQELAAAYGCSPNTVTRVVKAAIEPAEYEDLKRQRSRRAGQSATSAAPAPEPQEVHPPEACLDPEPPPAPSADPQIPLAPSDASLAGDEEDAPAAATAPSEPPETGDQDHEAARGLAIDDAEDFDDYEPDDQEDDDDGDDQEEDDGDAGFLEQTFVEVPISLDEALNQPLTTPRPWCADELPTSAFMLVDKTVELQARPLGEIPELGRLDAAELELQALVLYSNPRQAKRHCGRTQRVIPVPDVGVIERRATYLVRQGIRRVVVEGTLYALPGA